MMRLILTIVLSAYLVSLTACTTDSFAPGSDDEISSAADDASVGDQASASDQSGDDQDLSSDQASNDGGDQSSQDGADQGDKANSGDDLGSELDGGDQNQAQASDDKADEQSLEQELDQSEKGDEQGQADNTENLDNNVSQEQEPPAPKNEPPVESQPIQAQSQKVRITNIRYTPNQAGGSVIVEGTGPLTYHAHTEGTEFIIDVDNAELPPKLKHSYPLRDYSGAFVTMNAEQLTQDSARIVVQMKSASAGEPIVQTEGNSLIVVPSSTPMVAEAAPEEKPKEKAVESPLAAHTLDEFLTGNQRFFGKPISIQTKDADVRDVINFISEESGANIVMSDDVKGRLSIKVRKIPWDQALVTVMRAKHLGYIRQGNVLRISSMKELQEESDQALKMLETQRNLAPVRVKVIPINYANVEELVKQVPAFMSKEGKVVVDQRSNTILVTDRENVLDKVERIIKALDVQPNQVMIEGKIVEAQDTFASFIGVNWNVAGTPATLSGSGGFGGQPITAIPTLVSTPVQSGVTNFLTTSLQIGTLDFFGSLDAALSMAEQDQVVKVISSPRIATMNKQKAEISQAGENVTVQTIVMPGATPTTALPMTQVERTPIVLDLTVTPQVTMDSSIIMDIEVKRQFAGSIVDQTTQARPINTRTAKTKILVRNGQTAVIGGIYGDDDTLTDDGVPYLKDIPVLGWLFKSRQRQRIKDELMIFLTPRIMQPSIAQDLSNKAAG